MTNPDKPKTLPLPGLEFRAPDCPLCDRETNPNDGEFDCEGCRLAWAQDGTGGYRMDDPAPLCTSECMPYADRERFHEAVFDQWRDNRYRCLLTEGHTGEHRGARCDPLDLYDIRQWSSAKEVKAVSA